MKIMIVSDGSHIDGGNRESRLEFVPVGILRLWRAFAMLASIYIIHVMAPLTVDLGVFLWLSILHYQRL